MRFITNDRLKKMTRAILVDMRSPVEFRDSKVTNAINLPLRNLVNHLTLIRDKSIPVVLFCADREDEELKMGGKYSENLGFDTYYTDLKQLQEEKGIV
jgi:hypothetical protein